MRLQQQRCILIQALLLLYRKANSTAVLRLSSTSRSTTTTSSIAASAWMSPRSGSGVSAFQQRKRRRGEGVRDISLLLSSSSAEPIPTTPVDNRDRASMNPEIEQVTDDDDTMFDVVEVYMKAQNKESTCNMTDITTSSLFPNVSHINSNSNSATTATATTSTDVDTAVVIVATTIIAASIDSI